MTFVQKKNFKDAKSNGKDILKRLYEQLILWRPLKFRIRPTL